MKIQPLNQYNIQRNNNSDNIYFTGYKTSFSKRLEKVIEKNTTTSDDRKFLTDRLQNFLNFHMQPSKELGSGFHGIVYKIDDKFVAKMRRGCKPYALFMDTLSDGALPARHYKDLKTYYGEPVATFYDINILKNVSAKGKATPAGVPTSVILNSTDDEVKYYYDNIYLPKFARVPQKSFDAIAKDCVTLNKMGDKETSFCFDYVNPNNFVLVGNTLRITDEIIQHDNSIKNTTADLLNVFLMKANVSHFVEYNPAAVNDRMQIFEKIVLAGMKWNLPLKTQKADELVWKIIINKLCRLKTPYSDVLDNLTKLQKTVKSPQKRVQLSKEYIENLK